MAKTLKVGVIGVGGIAHAHFPGWKESPLAEMAAFSDVVPETLKRVGAEQGVTTLYGKPEDLIQDPDLDLIDICTPNMYHAPLACAALKAGKHVICEKPLAPTPKDIKQMIAARDKSGKLLMTAQHFRYQGTAQALKAEIDRGALGNVYHARGWMLRRSGAPTRPGFILKQHSGGGPCIDIGVHILDLTLWMMGFPKPVAVSGVTRDILAKKPGAFSNWGGPIPKEWDVEEFASAFVRFDNGATLILEVSWLLNHNSGPGEDMQMWLYGDKGGSHWPSNLLLATDNNTKQHLNTQLQNAAGGEPHAKECMAFAEAVTNGAPSPVPAEQSLIVIGILDGLYRSAAAGREVAIKL
jgi:predicted dehydrogenase